MALCAVRWNRPSPGAASCVVSHSIRSAPVSLVNDSVCRLPWPDQDPSLCHTTLRAAAGLGSSARARQPPHASAYTASAACSVLPTRPPPPPPPPRPTPPPRPPPP